MSTNGSCVDNSAEIIIERKWRVQYIRKWANLYRKWDNRRKWDVFTTELSPLDIGRQTMISSSLDVKSCQIQGHFMSLKWQWVGDSAYSCTWGVTWANSASVRSAFSPDMGDLFLPAEAMRPRTMGSTPPSSNSLNGAKNASRNIRWPTGCGR